MRIAVIMLGIAVLISCETSEGPGGRASIEGALWVKEYNRDFSLLLDKYPARGHDVYLNYDNTGIIGDDRETGLNGEFSFAHLQPGNYYLWYYSEDSASAGHPEIAVEHELKLEKKETKKPDTLFALQSKDFDDGSASICGKVMLINYKNSADLPYDDSDIKDVTPAQEEDVYLIYNNRETYDEHVETNYNGKFCFRDLIQGEYRVFIYSEDLPGGRYDINSGNVIRHENSMGTYDLAVYQDVQISGQGAHIQLDVFYTEQE